MEGKFDKSIYVSEKHQTFRENFVTFTEYVAQTERGNLSKEDKAAVFNKQVNQMTVPEMKADMIEYHEKVTKGGFLFNKQNALEETLSKMHYHEVKGIVSATYAETMSKDKDFRKNTVVVEAKDLLSGSSLYTHIASAMEAKNLRETIVVQNKEIVQLNTQNKDLGTKLEKVNKALTNLVSNLKQKLGFSEEKINDLMNTPAAIEKPNEISKVKIAANKKGNDISM